MRTLLDLLNSPQGIRFLEAKGVYVAPAEFSKHLRPAAKPDLADRLGLENENIIWSGQQLYVDYRRSVLSKIFCLQDITQAYGLFPLFLWADTDRSGSDTLITKFAWPGPNAKGRITIAPPQTDEIESRFVILNSRLLRSAIDRLETSLYQSGEKTKTTKDNYRRLRELFMSPDPGSLSAFNLRLTEFLMSNVLGFMPPSVVLSDLLRAGLFIVELDVVLNCLTDVIAVYNQAIQVLIQQDIDPQVNPLPKHYLPLFFSCERDNRRIRLSHQIAGRDHVAVATCKCGQSYRFHLGQTRLSMAEIAQTQRWSPDVTLPLLVNSYVSGLVAGKSSALYGLVLNEVLSQVCGQKPVPMLVPERLGAQTSEPEQVDSLLYTYLAGERRGHDQYASTEPVSLP